MRLHVFGLHLVYGEPLTRVVWVVVQGVQLLEHTLTCLRKIRVRVPEIDASTHVSVLEPLRFDCKALLEEQKQK